MSTIVLRAISASIVSTVVGLVMAVGAYFADIAGWEITAIGVLGGMGAAVYVLFFAVEVRNVVLRIDDRPRTAQIPLWITFPPSGSEPPCHKTVRKIINRELDAKVGNVR